MDLLPFTSRFLELLWRASWQASVLVLLVWIAQCLFGRRLAPKWRYALWLLVVVRLLAPVTPSSAWSVFNFGTAEHFGGIAFDWGSRGETRSVARDFIPAVSREAEAASAPVPTEMAPASQHVAPAPEPRLFLQPAREFLRQHVLWIWFLGVLVLAMRLAWGNYLFALQLRKRRRIDDPSVVAVLEECRERIGLRRTLSLIEVPELDSPALFGCFRLKLLLPEGMPQRFSPAELRHVFLHELAHVRRGDAAMNWLTTILQTLHWFNPVLWFAFHRMRADRELACDALALAYAQDGETKPYGHTVIKVLEGFTQATAIPGLVGILEDKQQMKERITMIAQFKKSSGWPVAAVALIALLGCVSLTDGKRDKAGANATAKKSKTTADSNSSLSNTDRQLLIQKTDADKFGRWVASPDSSPSPDGRYLAYVNWAFGNLAVCDTKTGELRDLTSEGTWDGPDQFAWRSVWSPDSKQVAFIWYKGDDCDLRLVNRNGGGARVLVPFEKGGNIWPQQWSKDGRFIVGLAPIKKWPKDAKRVFQIVRVDVATGVVKVVKELPDATDARARSIKLDLSPDGQHIAYEFPSGQLQVASIDGSSDARLIDHPAKHRSPRWLPDGKHLIFLSDRSSDEALWVVGMKDGRAVGEPTMVRDGFRNTSLLGFSKDGALHYLANTPRINVFIADVDFDAATMQTPQLVSRRNDGRNRNPRWSADGSELGDVSRQNEGTQTATLVFWHPATGKERIVENSVMNNFGESPRWSPDLSKLVGRAYTVRPAGAFYLVDVKAGQRTKLVDHPDKHVSDGNLSADGNYLIYRHHIWEGPKTVGCELIEHNLKSGQERVITNRRDSGFNAPMILSQDGSKLAACEGQGSLVVTARADGATKTAFEFPHSRAAVLGWLPDNRRLLVALEDEQQAQQLHLIDTETGNDRLFGTPFPRNDHIQHLSVHPGGKRIAFSRGDVIAEIWTMKNIVPPDKIAAK